MRGKLFGIGFGLVFGAMGAEACPQLQGTYSCKYKGFSINTVVQEARQKNTATYNIDYSIGKVMIVADGKQHTIERLPPMDRHARNFKYTAFCKGERVEFGGTGDMVNGSGVAQLNGNLVRQGKSAIIRVVVEAPAKTRTIDLVCNPN